MEKIREVLKKIGHTLKTYRYPVLILWGVISFGILLFFILVTASHLKDAYRHLSFLTERLEKVEQRTGLIYQKKCQEAQKYER
ncbi:hypothetical protein SAMN02745150_01174 [Brevinema andersonii]|uniref:Uncharacterized protein n=1 Tax=Brevinema andersonii TaxID=34097 RepID=A0A1I1EMC3_BREAD|nr:hypothetical protein [Brevinema andersonii]SFB88254.1 hypothetical protein SAMN02745150_01174 [Brevinema andersonii]